MWSNFPILSTHFSKIVVNGKGREKFLFLLHEINFMDFMAFLHVCTTTIILIFSLFHFQTPEDCSSGTDCLPMIISWEGSVDIQSGDVLIVGIDDKLLISSQKQNKSEDEM